MECVNVPGVAGSADMKICQLCAVDFTLKWFLLPLIDTQRDNGDEVIAVCSFGNYVNEMRADGYTIENIKISRSMNVFKHVYSIWKLYRYFRIESFDVVHVHTPVASFIGRIAAFFARVPMVVYTAHGFYFHDDMSALKKNFHIGLERFAGRFTDLLFTQSAEDAETAINLGIMSKFRVFAIGNGVDIHKFHSLKTDLRDSLGIPEEAFVIGMIGRLVEEKGVVEFLDAAIMVVATHPDAYFMLVGGRLPSDHASSVETKIDSAKKLLGKRLILTGLRDDIPDILSTMNLFCLPSWREGMPRTIIEAMMVGLAVVATNIRGSREEVIDEHTGLLVPVRDSKKLSTAIIRCIENPSWTQNLGKAGYERALNLYDEKKVVDFQIDIINRFV